MLSFSIIAAPQLPTFADDGVRVSCVGVATGNYNAAELQEAGGETVEVPAGKAVRIASGTTFRPSFPVDAEYVPVCMPAFRPDRCVRQESPPVGEGAPADGDSEKPEVLYHMTTVAEWEAAKAVGVYYPKTYAADGYYTHATGVPSRLLSTANHFYEDVPGAWVCLRFTRTALWNAGIHVRDEEAMPVGDKPVSDGFSKWICPHVIGGIPTRIVRGVFAMTREGTKFTGIDTLC